MSGLLQKQLMMLTNFLFLYLLSMLVVFLFIKYVDLIDDASKEMVKKFEDVPDGAENTELNKFVQQNLPDLRQHKEESDQLEESM